MGKIVTGLYATMVFPLTVLGAMAVWNAVREFREHQSVMGRAFLFLAAAASIIIAVVVFGSPSTKLAVGLWFYRIMEWTSPIAFVVAAGAAYHYSRDYETATPKQALPVLTCAILMLAAAGSTVHAMHQVANTQRIFCPACEADE